MTLQICIGYNKNIDGIVLQHSIRRRASIGVDIHIVPEHEILLSRPQEDNQSTPFSFTRFLSLYIWKYKGFTVFMDPDMLCLCDVREIEQMFDPQYVVQVVKHEYVPRSPTKFVDLVQRPQLAYPHKNWSSFMILNNEKCRDVYTLETVNTLSGLTLHGFTNLRDTDVGSLPKEYNYLVGEDNQAEQAKIVHFTNGMPYAPGLNNCQYADVWNQELTEALRHRFA